MNRFFNTAAAALLALGLSAGCGKESSDTPTDTKPVTLRMATQYPEDHPAHAAALRIEEAIEKGTDGRVNITVFPENQLGEPGQVFEGVQNGTIDAAHIWIPSQDDPRLNTGDLPYIARDYGELRKIFAPDAFIPMQVGTLLDKKNVTFFGYYTEGFMGVGTTGEAKNLRSLGTDKGVVVSISDSAAVKTGMEALGFRTTALPYSDVLAALKAGVVDGWVGGPPRLTYSGFREAITTYYQLNSNVVNSQYIMGTKVFRSFSQADRKVVAEAFAAESLKSFEVAEQEEISYRRKMTEAGITVNEFSRHELRAMADYVRESVWPGFEKEMSRKWMKELAASYADK
ncbi:TRAP transporter substrate-binding protein DctP [Desulfoluna butyratoxydans]|uniref:Trap transporter solute receptor dctp/teaa n=1 Tax=Desulfoluna butyratoxydans TaxID=231438 RepID=A0A4U8YXE8_9BACT|nr:TRAP transporter substrate-binding protein DctP [Desulfoluna butyratoxydans]VFQ46732.1 trap transporter solute receptor dctp/teaa [Desulfoluna butyratoxydans]